MARFWLVLCMALICMSLARAQTSSITRGEVSLLPEYCAYTITFGNSGSEGAPNDEQRRWVGIMGRGFWTMHHYCWALVGERRAGAAGVSAQQRDYLLKTAIDDCYFVIKHAPADFVMLPEVYTRMGDFSVKRGRLADAQLHYGMARELKPDYWPPYVRQAQMLLQLNQRQSAREIIELGLARMPDEPQLQDMHRRLTGKRGAISAERAASSPQ